MVNKSMIVSSCFYARDSTDNGCIIIANLLKKENIQLKKVNNYLEQKIAGLKSEEVKEEQLDPVSTIDGE